MAAPPFHRSAGCTSWLPSSAVITSLSHRCMVVSRPTLPYMWLFTATLYHQLRLYVTSVRAMPPSCSRASRRGARKALTTAPAVWRVSPFGGASAMIIALAASAMDVITVHTATNRAALRAPHDRAPQPRRLRHSGGGMSRVPSEPWFPGSLDPGFLVPWFPGFWVPWYPSFYNDLNGRSHHRPTGQPAARDGLSPVILLASAAPDRPSCIGPLSSAAPVIFKDTGVSNELSDLGRG